MRTLRLFVVFTVVELALAQQTPAPMLEISGDVPHPRVFHEQEWKQLRHISVSGTNVHEKKTATYTGVPLRDLLKEAGVPSGEGLRGKAMSTSIVATASDGYQDVNVDRGNCLRRLSGRVLNWRTG